MIQPSPCPHTTHAANLIVQTFILPFIWDFMLGRLELLWDNWWKGVKCPGVPQGPCLLLGVVGLLLQSPGDGYTLQGVWLTRHQQRDGLVSAGGAPA